MSAPPARVPVVVASCKLLCLSSKQGESARLATERDRRKNTRVSTQGWPYESTAPRNDRKNRCRRSGSCDACVSKLAASKHKLCEHEGEQLWVVSNRNVRVSVVANGTLSWTLVGSVLDAPGLVLRAATCWKSAERKGGSGVMVVGSTHGEGSVGFRNRCWQLRLSLLKKKTQLLWDK